LPSDVDEVMEFYKISYPDNWFDQGLLDSGFYFALKHENRLASIAGVHVYSKEYGVSALGNITTLPSLRGNGFATKVTAKVVKELLKTMKIIGLNVKSENKSAIKCYQNNGFEVHCTYDELFLKKK